MSASITQAAWTCLALPYFNFNDSHSVDQWGVPSENDTFRDLPIKSPGDPYQGDAHPSCRRTHTCTRYRVMSNEQDPWIKPEMCEWSGEGGVSTPTHPISTSPIIKHNLHPSKLHLHTFSQHALQNDCTSTVLKMICTGVVLPKINILSSFNQPNVIPDLYYFNCMDKNSWNFLQNILFSVP